MKNFFTEQKTAKRATYLLVALFLASFALIVFITQTFFGLIFDVRILQNLNLILYQGWDVFRQQNPYQWHWPSIIISILVIISAFIYKYRQLRLGGHIIAQQLGATLVQPNSYHPLERQLINVVEEMTIAAHTCVPRIYILLSQGNVNAFAAGHYQQDAVIAVTRGALEKLTRDELQAVVAHELSHIVNDDIKLNNRLAALTFSISFIGLAGENLIKKAASSKSRDGLSTLLGLLFIIYGFIGTLLADFIKATICRNREYLADACATQFNRNSEALANALKVVAGFKRRPHFRNYHQYSHLFFNNICSPWLTWFSTHPPITKRIKKLQPHWCTNKTEPIRHSHSNYLTMQLAAQRHQVDCQNKQQAIRQNPSSKPSIADISQELITFAHEPSLICHLLPLTLLNSDEAIQLQQLKLISNYPYTDAQQLDRCELLLTNLSLQKKFELIEIACNALHCLPLQRQNQLRDLLKELNILNQAETLTSNQRFRLCVGRWMMFELMQSQIGKTKGFSRSPHRAELIKGWQLLLSMTAHIGHQDQISATHAFHQTCEQFAMKNLPLLNLNDISLQKAHAHLNQVSLLAKTNRHAFLKAVTYCAEADHQLTQEEKAIIYMLSIRLKLPCQKL